jgi:hypothetical protein
MEAEKAALVTSHQAEVQTYIEKTAAAEALAGETRERYLTLEAEWKAACTKLAQREAKLTVSARTTAETEARCASLSEKLAAEERKTVRPRKNICIIDSYRHFFFFLCISSK